jgi:hypothetical protein
MAERSLEGCNEIIPDEAVRWLITTSLVPANPQVGVVTETRIIETEPSLWWRSEKWQEYQEVEIPVEDEIGNTVQEIQKVPVYTMCVVLNTEYIG